MKKLALLFLMLSSASHVMCSDIAWSFPSTMLSTMGLNASDAHIASDPHGNVVAIWVENGFVKANSKPLTMGWGSATTLSGSGSSSPRVVMDSAGNASAVWLESNGTVKSATKPLSSAWGSATALSGTGVASPDIAVDAAGDLIAVWDHGNNVESSTKLFGGSWQAHVSITSSSASFPRVAIGGTGSNTRAFVVWQGTSGTTNVIYSANKLVASNWNTPQIISDTNHNAANPSVAVDFNANAAAIWYQYDVVGSVYSNVATQAAVKTASDASFESPTTLSAAGIKNPANLQAHIAFDNVGNALAFWNTSFDDMTYNIESAVRPVGSSWSSATDLVSSNLFSSSHDVAVSSSGDALATYMFYNGNALMIESSESNINGFMNNSWSVPLIASQGNNNANPRVAAVLNGNAIDAAAVWINYNGTNTSVQAATGTRATILPPSHLTVAQSSTNFGAFTEFVNTLSWTASTDPKLAGYVIFRNGIFLHQVGSSATSFVDNNRVQNGPVTYGVAAINSQNSQSPVITVNFP